MCELSCIVLVGWHGDFPSGASKWSLSFVRFGFGEVVCVSCAQESEGVGEN